nr:retrovirus-related Pol polyprotein from transposon TNT 1-94 [Tanacetum cinerariifolium]
MTGDRSQLINIVQKFLGTVKFGNDHVEKIMGQFCDSDLEVAFRQHTCFICNLEIVDLLTACAMGKSTKKTHKPKSEDTNQEKLYILHMDLAGQCVLKALMERTRTMLIYAQAPLFLWAETVATACFTQNRSIVRLHHGKTPYELMHSKQPNLLFFYVFGALCYPTNNSENVGKLQQKADIGIFIGYAPTKKAFRIYNWHTRRIVETIHVDFDELIAMASEQSTTEVIAPIAEVIPQVDDDSIGSPSSTIVDQDAPSPSKSLTPTKIQSLVILQDVRNDNLDIEVAHMENDPLLGVPILEVNSE